MLQEACRLHSPVPLFSGEPINDPISASQVIMRQSDVNPEPKKGQPVADLINMGFEKEDRKQQKRKAGTVGFCHV